jgi:transposase-like protein
VAGEPLIYAIRGRFTWHHLPCAHKGNLPALEEELRRLRAENNRLQMERDILIKAKAFFAKESLETVSKPFFGGTGF